MQELESQASEAHGVTQPLPIIYVARHGETAWTVTGQHTGLTDLPLTAAGELNADAAGESAERTNLRQGIHQSLATRRSELVSWPGTVRSPKSIGIWSSGTTASMRASPVPRFARNIRAGNSSGMVAPGVSPPGRRQPGRTAWCAACVRCRVTSCCSQADISFVYWPPAGSVSTSAPNARSLMLSTASLSALGYENDLSRPVIRLWNDTHHVTS